MAGVKNVGGNFFESLPSGNDAILLKVSLRTPNCVHSHWWLISDIAYWIEDSLTSLG